MTFEEYLKVDAINASLIKAGSKSVYEAYQYLNSSFDESRSMQLGTAIHTAILEPTEFKSKYIANQFEDMRTKAAKDFVKENSGKIVLNKSDFQLIDRIKNNISRIPELSSALDICEKEKSYSWGGEVKMKARLDLVDEETGLVIDVKTTKDAGEKSFLSDFFRYGYDIQLLHYSLALSKQSRCFIVAIETDTAEIAMYEFTNIVNSALTKRRHSLGLQNVIAAKKLKESPLKYGQNIKSINMPEWAKEL